MTSVGESDAARIFDSIGQGSFGAALASSLNMGTAIYDATKDENEDFDKVPFYEFQETIVGLL